MWAAMSALFWVEAQYVKLSFTPVRPLSIGDPVVVYAPDSVLMYQVNHLELRRETWQSRAIGFGNSACSCADHDC